jgi:uncharacterized protein (DUF427 family)
VGEVERYRSASGIPVYQRGKEYGDRPDDGITYESTGRWVRATIGDTYIVDSKRALLLWEPGIPTSTYIYPAGDVHTDLFRPIPEPAERTRRLASQWFAAEVDGTAYDRLAWRYDEGPLAGYVGIDWFGRTEPGIEHWYEEDEEVWVHPRDPHHRVDAIPSSRHVQVSVDGRVLADTHNPVILYETSLPARYYIPREDVDVAALESTDLLTRCPYKGIAHYWSVPDVELGKNIVWSYPEPIAATPAIRDHLAFYNEVVDIVVDGVPLERPHSHFLARIVNDAPDTTGV